MGIKIIMIMVISIICNWTDDEPSASAAFREPEPIPDEIRTDWQNRERRDEQKDEMRERRTSAREDIEMKSGRGSVCRLLQIEMEEPETFEIHYIFRRCTQLLAVIIYST